MSLKHLGIWLIIAFGASSLPGKARSPSGAAQSAFKLYEQHQHTASADRFDRALKQWQDARILYYAALANRAASREARARQLFQYLVANHPQTQEAAYAQKALEASTTSPAQVGPHS